MLKSMTGFGRCEIVTKENKISVEIKSVNQRYCDIFVKMPRKLNFLDTAVRNLLKKYIGRGKIDIFINYEEYMDSSLSLRVNEPLAKQYVDQLNYLSKHFDIADNVSNVVVSRYPDVLLLDDTDIDETAIWTLVEKAIKGAAEELVKARTVEGVELKADILDKLQTISAHILDIEDRYPEVINEYKGRLRAKVSELAADSQIDETRLATELVYYSDKICMDEELVRLKSHVRHMRGTIEKGNNIGRKLDFIVQELNREANTILSKTNDIDIANYGLEIKTEIEKVREQIQNVE